MGTNRDQLVFDVCSKEDAATYRTVSHIPTTVIRSRRYRDYVSYLLYFKFTTLTGNVARTEHVPFSPETTRCT